jgi:hypothetical protein
VFVSFTNVLVRSECRSNLPRTSEQNSPVPESVELIRQVSEWVSHGGAELT